MSPCFLLSPGAHSEYSGPGARGVGRVPPAVRPSCRCTRVRVAVNSRDTVLRTHNTVCARVVVQGPQAPQERARAKSWRTWSARSDARYVLYVGRFHSMYLTLGSSRLPLAASPRGSTSHLNLFDFEFFARATKKSPVYPAHCHRALLTGGSCELQQCTRQPHGAHTCTPRVVCVALCARPVGALTITTHNNRPSSKRPSTRPGGTVRCRHIEPRGGHVKPVLHLEPLLLQPLQRALQRIAPL